MAEREVIAGESTLRLTANGAHYELLKDGVPVAHGEFSVERAGAHGWSVLLDGRSFLVRGDEDITVIDPRTARYRKVPGGAEGRQTIRSSMPGKVVRVLVRSGDTVEPGQGLVVVEAMKMQNEVKSNKAGVVASVSVADGATVNAGDVLVVVE